MTDPIYGGEGHGSKDARWLVVIEKLRQKRENETYIETQSLMDTDVREAMARAARRLHAEAMKYSVQGFTWDLDDIGYSDGGAPRTITATLRIARNGA